MLNCRQEHIHIKAGCVPTPVAPLQEALLTFLEEAQGRTVSHIDLAPPSCPSAICTVAFMITPLRQLSQSQQFTIHHLSLIQDSYVLVPLSLVDAHRYLRQLKKEPKWLTKGWDKVSPVVNGVVTVMNNEVFFRGLEPFALYCRMLTLLQEAGLGKEHRVFVHCFMGSLEDVLSWRSAFPRVLLAYPGPAQGLRILNLWDDWYPWTT